MDYINEQIKAMMEAEGIGDITASKHLRVNLLDVDKLVSANDLKPITNPIVFARNNYPTPDGLLSNEIFGITMYDRANTCAYIDLNGWFINPIVYKVWSKLDKKIIDCVYGTKNFIINGEGVLEETEDGENGIDFLKKNFSKINIARTASIRRDLNVDFIEHCKKDPGTFIRKQIVIPAYYRDVDTSKGGKISIGEINELYRNLIIASKALGESAGYGFDMSAATRGRIQGLIVQIYDWFGQGTTVKGITTGPNIPGKVGIIRRAVNGKTTDYATRLVMSAPDLKHDNVKDMQANLEYTALPLASALSNLMPFIIFNVKKYFDLMFGNEKSVPLYTLNKKTNKYEYSEKRLHVKDPQAQFSEERIKKEIERFIKGYSNRLIPITIETEEGPTTYMHFTGIRFNSIANLEKNIGTSSAVERRFTWCDLFYIAAVEAAEGKHVIVVRYPIDSIYNQFPTKIHINTTNETEPMMIGERSYPNYPKIRENMIGKNTSNMFVDTLNISNLYLAGLAGDYDGDTCTCKCIFSDEANAELDRVMKSNYNYIDSSGKGIRKASQECIQAMYNLTMVLPEDRGKISAPTF